MYPGKTYNLDKENYVETPEGKIKVDLAGAGKESKIVSVVFEIDSSISDIKD